MRPRESHGLLVLLASAATLSAPGTARAQDGWQFGPSLQVRHTGAGFRIRVNSFVHGDLRARRNFTDDGDGPEGLNGTETWLRRTRIGVEGEWRRFSFLVMADPRDDGARLKILYGEFRITRALRIRGGQIKIPASPEFLTSIARTDFIERSMIATDLGSPRDWGVMASGAPFEHFEYMLGVYAGDGRTQPPSRAQRTIGGRLAYVVRPNLDVGASWFDGNVAAASAVDDTESAPGGLRGVGASQFPFYDPHFVAGRRRRLGADARWARGPVSLRGEWLRATEEREGQGPAFEDLPAEIAEGWVTSATWLLTGEKKVSTILPDRPLSKGGAGAIEMGARYESLRFDDDGEDSGLAGVGPRAPNIRPAADRALTGGLSWWPESWLRVLGNVVLERFDDALRAPEPGRRGPYVTILGRLQVQLP